MFIKCNITINWRNSTSKFVGFCFLFMQLRTTARIRSDLSTYSEPFLWFRTKYKNRSTYKSKVDPLTMISPTICCFVCVFLQKVRYRLSDKSISIASCCSVDGMIVFGTKRKDHTISGCK